jgi:hypothetical protein
VNGDGRPKPSPLGYRTKIVGSYDMGPAFALRMTFSQLRNLIHECGETVVTR